MRQSKGKINSSKSKNYRRKAKNMASRGNYQDAAMLQEEGKEFDKTSPHTKFPAKVVGNDPKWYFKDPKILEDVASFSYATPLGSDLHDYNVYSPASPGVLTGGLTAVPGVMAIQLGLTPGVATDAQDPVNLAAQNVYTFVRYKNSGHANYDAPDLMMYLLAMDSAYACWNWLKRIYGYASTYSQVNRYKPKAFAEAENVDLDNIYANLADFRAYLNMAAGRLSAFCVPAVMTYSVRHSWLFSNIWTDSETTKAQSYMYVPAYFYKFSETASAGGSTLTPVNVLYNRPSTKYLWTDLTNILDSIINALQYSEDIGIMSGDILKAYGEGGLFTVSTFEADYRVDGAYHRGVLSQIENSMPGTIWSNLQLSQFNVAQDPNTNYIKFQPKIAAPNPINDRLGFHMNFHWMNPTAEDVIEATRLMWSAEVRSSYLYMTSCGSEIALATNIYYFAQSAGLSTPYQKGAQLNLYSHAFRQAINASYQGGTEIGDLVYQIYLVTAFDWAPEYRVYYQNSDTAQKAFIIPPIKDWDVYTTLDNQNINALNLLALLSEFNVPA